MKRLIVDGREVKPITSNLTSEDNPKPRGITVRLRAKTEQEEADRKKFIARERIGARMKRTERAIFADALNHLPEFNHGEDARDPDFISGIYIRVDDDRQICALAVSPHMAARACRAFEAMPRVVWAWVDFTSAKLYRAMAVIE